MANYFSNNISVLLNAGTGSFNTQIAYAVGFYPTGVSTADFNGDGKSDIVSANDGSNTVSVLLNTGTGSFGTQTTYTVGHSSNSVSTADFNGDGKSDIVTTNGGSNTISVLLNNGTGAFSAQTTYTVGAFPDAISIADFNADGMDDVVTANASGNTVSVLLNTSSVLGIEQMNTNSYRASVSPNPSGGAFQITGCNLQIVEIKMYDLTGKLVLTQNFSTVHLKGENIEIDASCLDSGVYWLNIVDNDGMVYQSKVTKID